jgi:hypothetical protein
MLYKIMPIGYRYSRLFWQLDLGRRGEPYRLFRVQSKAVGFAPTTVGTVALVVAEGYNTLSYYIPWYNSSMVRKLLSDSPIPEVLAFSGM